METKQKEFEIYGKALESWGIRKQRMMLVEECGELLNVIAKSTRVRAGIPEIVTELADVHIMVEQMALFYGWERFIEERNFKLERLEKRLNNLDK